MKTDREVNIPLLRKAVEWAEAEAAKPADIREWEQGYYVVPVRPDDPVVSRDGSPSPWVEEARQGKSAECGTCYCIAGRVAFETNGPTTYDAIHDVAKDALGITSHEAHRLFESRNTIEDVRRIAEDIAGERL